MHSEDIVVLSWHENILVPTPDDQSTSQEFLAIRNVGGQAFTEPPLRSALFPTAQRSGGLLHGMNQAMFPRLWREL
jgi:hypothetical protein